jgi:hypothetical protein
LLSGRRSIRQLAIRIGCVTASGTMKDVPCDCKNLVPASWAVKIYLSLRHDDPYVGPASKLAILQI